MILRKKINRLFVLVGLSLLLSSCLKEELPVAKPEPGDAIVRTVEMGEKYKNTVYFDLETNEIIKTIFKTEWDLAFESNGEHITLNTAKGMNVHRSTLEFADLTSEDDLDWVYDVHSGNLDSTAFGDWKSDNFLYVIDAGYDEEGEHQGYFKIKITEYSTENIHFLFGPINDTAPVEFEVEFKTETQFTYFSFIDQEVVDIAPADFEYDIIFTQYTHLFKDPVTPYLVSGVVLNRGFTSAKLFTDKKFEDITLDDALALELSYDLNAIGYEWKGFDLEEGIYTTYPEMNYIIKTSTEIYYKLHFTNFYSEDGIKGYPTFEFQAL
ncbi:HmuY family protein [Crocinitomix algicola]|uniref:HmuY family protein n=1 Tax=Crocinitomix algicola TaxID=1740263 RepID=UPI000872FC89|nr:HmuY family protein [Crocinitomix algicola]